MYRAWYARRRIAAVAKLGVIMILVAACSGEADTTTEPTAAATTTSTTTPTTAPATTPATTAEAASQELLLTFDGEQCIYDGPSQRDRSEPFTLTLVNNSDLFALGVVLWVPPDLVEEVMPTVGTDYPFSDRNDGTSGGLTDTFYVEVPSGSEMSLTGLAVAAPGTYVLECVSAEGATMVHTWRPAAIEFS